jgi:hypothetical protein
MEIAPNISRGVQSISFNSAVVELNGICDRLLRVRSFFLDPARLEGGESMALHAILWWHLLIDWARNLLSFSPIFVSTKELF